MVTRKEYISLLKNPLVKNANVISQLEELQDKYPFCGNIQMLLTKGYHSSDNISYEEQLKNTAISIPNRENLYNLIYKTLVTTEISKITEVDKTEPTLIEPEIKKEDFTDKKEHKTTKKILSIEKIIQSKEISPDKLEELILSHAIGSSYVLTEDKKEETITNTKEEKNNILKHHSFYSWLNPTEPISSPGEKSKESINNLVEKFIYERENEKIKRKDFFSPTNVAKLSIVETNDFITETLADIYFKQNMYDKALNAYEKLILKNPEKKTYFASQITKIKSLLE